MGPKLETTINTNQQDRVLDLTKNSQTPLDCQTALMPNSREQGSSASLTEKLAQQNEKLENAVIFDPNATLQALTSSLAKSFSLGVVSAEQLIANRAILEMYESQQKKKSNERDRFSPTVQRALLSSSVASQFTEADKELLGKLEQMVPGLSADTAMKLPAAQTLRSVRR